MDDVYLQHATAEEVTPEMEWLASCGGGWGAVYWRLWRFRRQRGEADSLRGDNRKNDGGRGKMMMRMRSLFLMVVFAGFAVGPLGAQTSEDAGGRGSARRADQGDAQQALEGGG